MALRLERDFRIDSVNVMFITPAMVNRSRPLKEEKAQFILACKQMFSSILELIDKTPSLCSVIAK